jgi:hypothetical protein
MCGPSLAHVCRGKQGKLVKLQRLLQIAILLGLALLHHPRAFASSDNSDALAYFPTHCSEVAHVDLAEARQFPWFAALKTKFVPVQFYRFETFISSPKLGIGNQITSVDWAQVMPDGKSPGGILIIATGEFDRQTAESALDDLKVPAFEIDGHILYATASDLGDADLLVTFLDSDMIAIGSRGVLAQAVRLRTGDEPSILDDSSMMQLIRQQDSDGIFWSVSTAEAARAALRRLLPRAGAAPAADQLIASISSLVASGKGSSNSEFDIALVAATNTPEDALALSRLFEAGLLLKRFQIGQLDAGVAEILGTVDLVANGNQITVSLSVKNADVATLIQHDDLLIPAM